MGGWIEPAVEYIASWILFQREQLGLPGISVAIGDRDEMLLDVAYGVADQRTGERLTPKHRFRVASHSKTFTAAGVMKLVEAGKLRLDDPAGRYVDGLAPQIGAVTLAQLLSHTAGVRRDGADAGQWSDRRSFLSEAELRVDLAHAAERTALESFDTSQAPCIISHANARALADHPRNVSNEVLKALAKRGGVIGITAYAPFIRAKREGRPAIEHMVEHVAYVADLVGIDHVGIGSDHFEAESDVRYAAFATWFPDSQRGYRREDVNVRGFERVDDWPRLTEALLRHGFSDTETRKILGENHLRVFRAAWGRAKRFAAS